MKRFSCFSAHQRQKIAHQTVTPISPQAITKVHYKSRENRTSLYKHSKNRIKCCNGAYIFSSFSGMNPTFRSTDKAGYTPPHWTWACIRTMPMKAGYDLPPHQEWLWSRTQWRMDLAEQALCDRWGNRQSDLWTSNAFKSTDIKRLPVYRWRLMAER